MTGRNARRGMGRYGRLAARLDELEDAVTELLARMQRVELYTGTPTTLDLALRPDENENENEERGGHG